jgi:hypothetical protein
MAIRTRMIRRLAAFGTFTLPGITEAAALAVA